MSPSSYFISIYREYEMLQVTTKVSTLQIYSQMQKFVHL